MNFQFDKRAILEKRAADKARYAPMKARLRILRDQSAATLADTKPLAAALLAGAVVVYSLLNNVPTFSLFPPADGLTILEGYHTCNFPAASAEEGADDEVMRTMTAWAVGAVEGGFVLPSHDAEHPDDPGTLLGNI